MGQVAEEHNLEWDHEAPVVPQHKEQEKVFIAIFTLDLYIESRF